MFAYENFMPFNSFNESSIFFRASEVFRYGYLLADISQDTVFKQLYSYHNYYVEVVFGENYEEIKTIDAISIDLALERYVDEDAVSSALIDLLAQY